MLKYPSPGRAERRPPPTRDSGYDIPLDVHASHLDKYSPSERMAEGQICEPVSLVFDF
jgi:hypothetical protein